MISQQQADIAVSNNNCKYLIKDRVYKAPLALSVKGDLKNAVQGIDECVILDGGDSYVLKHFEWVRVDESGATQLSVEFHTMDCN